MLHKLQNEIYKIKLCCKKSLCQVGAKTNVGYGQFV